MLAYEGAKPAPSTAVTLPPKGTEYYFNIGSVETFERNLLDAQQRAGVPPESYLPVCETSCVHIPSVLRVAVAYCRCNTSPRLRGCPSC